MSTHLENRIVFLAFARVVNMIESLNIIQININCEVFDMHEFFNRICFDRWHSRLSNGTKQR